MADGTHKRGEYLEPMVRGPLSGSLFENMLGLTLTAETYTNGSGVDSAVMSLDVLSEQDFELETGDACYFDVRVMCVSMINGWVMTTFTGQIAAYRLGETGISPVGGGMTQDNILGLTNYKDYPDVPVITMLGGKFQITVQHTNTGAQETRYRWVASVSGPMLGGGYTT